MIGHERENRSRWQHLRRRRRLDDGKVPTEATSAGEDGCRRGSVAMPDSDAVQEAPCCFVIGPIGGDDTDVRKRSDQMLEHIIRPVVSKCGYSAVRADQMPKPGMITSQVLLQVIEAPLVIADLTDHNPNVFYELGVRHSFRKPVIQLIQADQGLPFDVAGLRTIFVDHRDLDSVAACQRELRRHIEDIRSAGDEADSPISAAVDLAELRRSGNPLEKSNAEILESLAELRHMLGMLTEREVTRRRQENRAAAEAFLNDVKRKAVRAYMEREGADQNRLSGSAADALLRLFASTSEPSVPRPPTPGPPWVPPAHES